MDADRFDNALRVLATASPRRHLLFSLVSAISMAVTRLPDEAHAKKRKKPKPNSFGCLDVGKHCRGKDGKCCSGVCRGKRPKKDKKDRSKCVAHNVGVCQAGQDSCAAVDFPCGDNGLCYQTTGKASFCGAIIGTGCADCTKDTDCELGSGLGAACVLCAGQCPDTGGRGCFSARA